MLEARLEHQLVGQGANQVSVIQNKVPIVPNSNPIKLNYNSTRKRFEKFKETFHDLCQQAGLPVKQ